MILPRHPASLAATSTGADRWLGLLMALAAGLLVLAWFLPMMTVYHLRFVAETFSIADSIGELLREDEIGLFLLILVFTVLFPVAKLVLAGLLWYRADLDAAGVPRWLAWIDGFGKWSMLDVFVVALVVVAIKISWLADVAVHPGVYVYASAVVLSMVAERRVASLAHARIAGKG